MEVYSMKELRPLSLMEKKLRIEGKINEYEKEKNSLTSRITEICGELSELNKKVKANTYLPDYNEICEKQVKLLKEKTSIEKKVSPIRQTLRELHHESDVLQLEIKKMPDDKAKSLILEARDRYMSFAADTTRVSSMRAMASKFSEELQFILKYLP